MKLLIQRVLSAAVTVDGQTVGKIKQGALVLIGIKKEDDDEKAKTLAKKLVHLRFFNDEAGKFNKSLLDIKGEVLIVSQFTLYANCTSGRRPSFTDSAEPEIAKRHYESFVNYVRHFELKTETGIFAANMQVSLVNDGPVTLILEI